MKEMLFYNRGREDNLRKLPANPLGAGTTNPQQYNEYMNGYNSVQQRTDELRELAVDLSKIIRRSRNIEPIKDSTLVLSELLIKSLEEPASEITPLDRLFHLRLDELEVYDPDLRQGFKDLYNAVQKSKRFKFSEGELTKYLNESPAVVPPKNKRKKK